MDELLHEKAAARTLTRLLPRRRCRRLVRVEALAIGQRLARFDKRCNRRGIDIAPRMSTKHLIVLRQALLKGLIVRAAVSGVPVHPLTLDDRGERRDGHTGGDTYGTHARAASVLHPGVQQKDAPWRTKGKSERAAAARDAVSRIFLTKFVFYRYMFDFYRSESPCWYSPMQ